MGVDKTLILLFGGASGSGKTTIAEMLMKLVPENISKVIISLDDYYPDNSKIPFKERCKINYDDPAIFDYALLADHLKKLKQGKSIQKPTYSFTEHTRTDKTELIEPVNLIIVEGLYTLFNKKVLEVADFKIYVDTPMWECALRRVMRDCQERGRDMDEVANRLRNDVVPMFYKHVYDTRKNADMMIEWSYYRHQSIDGLVRIIKSYF